jgi:hypothetical protein
MRLTILHAFALLVLAAVPARGQNAPPDPRGPFAAHAWHAEAEAIAAFEAWNYNVSHEDVFGLNESVTYGLRDGVVLRAGQRLAYVSQRAEDAVLLGLTIGVRARVAQRGRVTAFVQTDVGITHTAIATPPRGTRFNYLAIGGGGVMIRVRPRVHVFTTAQLIHISNASVKGPGRNPDLEAIGPAVGLNLRF